MIQRDADKTAIVLHHCLFRYSRMPFGLENAPATFQKAMDVILASVKLHLVIVFIDAIIIFSWSPQQHIDYTEKVSRLIKKARLPIKMKKCHFLCKSIDYLRHIIASGKQIVAQKTTEAVVAPRYATTARLLQCLISY